MVDDNREIELKLELDDGGAEALRTHAALAELQPEITKQSSVYFDTGDGALRKAGFSLRVRKSKGRHIQTVKRQAGTAAGLFDRPEWEAEVNGPDPDWKAAAETPLRELLTKKFRKRLEPLIRSEMTRTTWIAELDGAKIEVVLDEGDVVGGEARQSIAELELELKGGAPAMLIGFAATLSETLPVRLGVLTKAERGYRLADGTAHRAAKAERIELDAGMSAAAGFTAIAYSCLRQFRLNEPLVIGRKEPVALHQARVAMRRLRSAFTLFRPVIAGDEVFAGLREDVRWFTNQLGDARNLDVLLKRVGDRSEPLRALLEAERESAYRRVLDALGSARQRRLMLDLVAWIETGPWPEAKRAREPLADFASDQLDKRWRKVRKGGRGLSELHPEARHQLRIEVKKLRYAIEFLAALQTGDAAKRQKLFAAEVEELQEQLGHLNDAETARDLLAGLLGDRPDRETLLRSVQGDDGAASEDETIEAAMRAYHRLIDIGRFWR
jgi:inorganic triphosphatase YgiF